MQLQKLFSLREGQRRVVSRQLEKFDGELSTAESRKLLEILTEKTEAIKTLNDKIVNHADMENIENELEESESYSIDLAMKLECLRESISKKNIPDGVNKADQNRNHNHSTDTGGAPSRSIIPEVSSHFSHKLPKLSLPTFKGDITEWQTFWDCYDSSVHSNTTLSDVQKFSYLRSLLYGAAASCISGFPLTHTNYVKAVELLTQRFGQTHKIISSYMQSLLELPRPENNPVGLQMFHDKLETYIRGLESLGQNQESYGDLLVPIIRDKLPNEVRRNIARDHGNNQWKLHELRAAIEKEVSILQAGDSTDYSNEHNPTALFFTGTNSRKRNRTDRQRSGASSRGSATKKLSCPFCDEQHSANDCKNEISAQERVACVKRKKLCFNCLSGTHQVSTCRSHFRCRTCQRKHHTSICDQQQAKSSTLNPDAASFLSSTASQPDGTTPVLHSSIPPRANVLLKTAVAHVQANEYSIDANILFDEGSQRSFITEKLANTINLQPTGSDTIYLASFGGSTHNLQHIPTGTVYLLTDSGEKISVNVLIVPTIAVPLQNVPREVHSLTYLKGLKLAHPVTDDDSFEISILIGADSYWKIVQNRVVRGDGPTAVQSKLGYLLSGPFSDNTSSRANHMMNVIASPPDNFDLERFWKLESLGITPLDDTTSCSSYMENYMETSISYSEGRYCAKLPWKEDHPSLPSNYDVSKRRTESMIRRLCKEPQLFTKYSEIIQEQRERGFIEVVNDTTAPDHPVHYIPHHGVKKDSATTPIRVVYDCSCRQSADKPSLNDCLQNTPPELNDLTGILMRFRVNKYAISTDIEKAFLHVALDTRDRDVTRFLWLSDPANPDSPLSIYRFRVVLFGATCSPFILCATIIKHLENNKSNWVSEHLHRDIYVDNIISSFPREIDVIQYFKDTRLLMSSGNFNLRSWNSNSKSVRDMAETEKVLDSDTTSKILGMRWEAYTDVISYPERSIPILDQVTKRLILQHTSRQYDPLGLLTPVTIRAKILLQELWQQKYTWDYPLPAGLQQKWHCIATDMNTVSAHSFSRYLFTDEAEDTPHTADDTRIHVFSDASMSSYGAAAYITRQQQSALVIAKSRVAPLKGLTLPRLELMAAVIGARLAKHVQQELNIQSIELWSDSQIVLHWLQSSKTLPRFVRNRVTEIHDLTENRKWRYCPTKDNPADLLTRGITASQLIDNALWFNGPDWIAETEKWPIWDQQSTAAYTTVSTTEPSAHETEQPLHVSTSPGINNIIDIEKYGSMRKLLRVTAYVTRFLYNCKHKGLERRLEPLTSTELYSAEQLWIQSCQQSAFKAEFENLRSGRSRLPLVKQLRLYIDNTGFLRCGGRIHNAKLADETKFPYLLPKNHTFTRLVIRDAHERLFHSGTSSTITYLRQKYCVPAARQCVKSMLRKCVTCRKVNSKPYSAPDPPPLPNYRVQEETPFSVTGVDFTGALYVRETGGLEKKVYICLFTCASTRAVHLEIVTDLTEGTFMLAFRRFVSRRSLPRLMLSDNALTYVAASNHLKKLFDSPSIQDELSNRGTEWRFIPKRAPWFGGWWERLIGITKTTLKKILGQSCITTEALQTVVTEIESMMNDRPLTYLPTDVAEPEPLTPAHLLYGRRLTALPYTDPESSSCSSMDSTRGDLHSILARADHQSRILDQFTKRWKHEYLTSLREFHGMKNINQTYEQKIRVGDVVQIHDESPRLKWKLAIIDELITGNDGFVRAARIRTKHGLSTRPIVKLYPLEAV